MKRVCVILASYNGSNWIKDQIQSIINQKNVKIDLVIFDDNSSDNTLQIIKNISKKNKNIFYKKNFIRKGSAAQNFFKLLLNIDFKKYDYISLSDQDDIWEKKKIFRAIKMINSKKIDCYSSDVSLLYRSGKLEYLKKSQKQTKMDFLFEGGGPGSTYVLTNKFINALIINLRMKPNIYKRIKFHDWYIYFFARINGFKWFIDSFSSLKYRQHEANELGGNIGLKKKLKRFKFISDGNMSKQLKYFFKLNISKSENYQFLFSTNFFKTFIFLIKNFIYFRRKNSEKLYCLIILIIILFKKGKIV